MRIRLLGVAAVVVGCGGSAGATSGTLDASVEDAPTTDAQTTDTQTIDATTADAQTSDSPTADARTTDAISDVDATAADGGPHDAASTPETGGPIACGDAACGSDEICIRGLCTGCCNLPPRCIAMPTGCTEAPACGCFAKDPCGGCTTCRSVEADGIHCGGCQCVCAAPWTPIDTPEGPQRIADLHAGDLVYSVDRGQVVVVPVLRVGRRSVTRHAVVRMTLESGAVIEMSGGHPTADGRRFDALGPRDRLGEARIASVAMVPYDEPFTYDILPASDTGTYFSNGAWIGSTMHASAGEACAGR
jgi:hypothetical protein